MLRGRQIGRVWLSALADPPGAAEEVLAAVGARAHVPTYGDRVAMGALALQVVGPVPDAAPAGANDASLVVVAEVSGVRILLTGDIEPPAQRALTRTLPDLEVDVLKVPHHGSRHQEFDFLAGLGARVAVVSAGEENDYGHPAPETLRMLNGAGMEVLRTDLDGDVVVVRRDEGLRLVR